jgi:predicted membrane-bound dolichyl-phosphate-mannose-protein mannosyltransferase
MRSCKQSGTLSILLVYLLAREIFKDKLIGILSAAIFSFDGLPLVLSRMGMNDSYVLFFSLLSVYLFIKDKNFWSAFVFGLAIASKWSGVYTFPILFISHFVFRKKIKISYLSFLVIPIIVYIASYGVMFSTGHTWTNFVDTQKQMWWYHTNLVGASPCSACLRPLLLRHLLIRYRSNTSC